VGVVESGVEEFDYAGAPRGTPAFAETVVDDARCARLLRSAHLAAEHGDRLASASLLTAALAAILSAHARLPGYEARPRRARKSAAAVTAVRGVLADRLADPPGLDELALATGMSPFALLRAFRDETGLPPSAALAGALAGGPGGAASGLASGTARPGSAPAGPPGSPAGGLP
jgi:hypothetical protein